MHRAVYKGKQVAIKVQRAGLKELFDTDLKNLKVLVKLLDKFDPKSDGADRSYADIYDESAKLLYQEIDYVAEGQNCIRFAQSFKDVGIDYVKVYIYIYIHIHTYIYIHIYIYIYIYIYICMYVCMYVYIYTAGIDYVQVPGPSRVYRIERNSSISTHLHIYIYIYIYRRELRPLCAELPRRRHRLC